MLYRRLLVKPKDGSKHKLANTTRDLYILNMSKDMDIVNLHSTAVI